MASKRHSPGLLLRRRALRSAFLLAAGVSIVGVARRAHAQSDVSPPLPNVLILLDTSGSMERMTDGTLPAVPVGTTSTTIKNRWISALEVLGGSMNGYQMLAVGRNSSDFINEYALGGASPYDSTYYLPHFRPVSNGCTIGAPSLAATKTWTTGPEAWNVSDFGYRTLSGSMLGAVGGCTASTITTDGLGVLDTFRDQARFALMTFDNAPDANTGYTSGIFNGPLGIQGQWSYFPGYDGSGGSPTPTYGWPNACLVADNTALATHAFEVGARNPYAPAWEGPMIRFAANDSTTELERVNTRIKSAIMAARPFGATPTGPMLADAQYYLTKDPNGPSVLDTNSSCRGQFIILITDGFPNQDLRPSCQNSGDPTVGIWGKDCSSPSTTSGCCPSKRAQDIAYDLAHPAVGKPAIQTFVVGFALSDETTTPPTPVDCSTIDPATPICTTMAANDPRQPCCTLHQIAYNGGTGKALIATDSDSLRAALLTAMNSATMKTATSRTTPVFSSVANSSGFNSQAEFRSSFKVNAFAAWTGVLERVRWTCQPSGGGLVAQPQPLDASKGDDFGANLNSNTAVRHIVSADATTTGASSAVSLRPNLAAADNEGVGTASANSFNTSASTITSFISPAAMNLTATSCSDTTVPSTCEQKYLNYTLGLPQPTPKWMSRAGNALGDIYHATPVAVTPPSGYPRDESYTAFKAATASRPPFLLAATNDGMLHAFDTSVTTSGQNELFAFIPPAVLPQLGKQYGGAHALLLDAAPVVADVPFGAATSTTKWGRSKADAAGGNATWKTVAVGGLTAGGGYYALDVTDPTNPKMLWQLTQINGVPLFGPQPAQPAIGTVYYSDHGGPTIETPVAFLPGGSGTIWNSSTMCQRWAWGTYSTTNPQTTPRQNVRCWTGPGQSMTIVRLWDGKVIRSFRNDPLGALPNHPTEAGSAAAQFIAAGHADVVKDATMAFAGIDSPITGAVMTYPGGNDSVTTRAFVGDSDGSVWRLDVSDPNPQNWKFGLFSDPYYIADSDNLNPAKWGPVQVPPIISIDRFGNVVVNYATGDQSNFDPGNINYVMSVSESTSKSAGLTSIGNTNLNWRLKLTAGITPTGPLSLFNSTLYFATFSPGVPVPGSQCLSGQGMIWAVDYLRTEPGTALPAAGFVQQAGDTPARYGGSCPSGTTPWNLVPNQSAAPGTTNYFRCLADIPPGTIIFGAGVTQRPSCAGAQTTGTDPYFGGSHTTVASISPGDFQLVAQTGPKAGGSTSLGTTTNTITRTLTRPQPLTRVDSWAAIVE